MKTRLGLEMRTSLTQEVQLICNCCGQPYYPNKSWEDRMRVIVFGAEKYSVCPLCTQEVPSDVFEDEGYRERCQSEVARLQRMLTPSLPTVVYHADWGTDPKKRWLCKATRLGTGYIAQAPAPVGDHFGLLNRVRCEAGATGTAVVGFDFPIGIPSRYAASLGVADFKAFLLQLGHNDFSDFYRISARSWEISKHRPFYPHKPGGTKHSHLLSALGVACIDDLRRKCELGHDGRKPACPLFWTLGANQVGRAAIIGWRDVIAPALEADKSVLIWPFDGYLEDLLQPGTLVIVETYPAECYRWFFECGLKGKGKLDVRREAAPALLNWAQSAKLTLDPKLGREIEMGFVDGEDDAFDATIGLFGMIEVLLDRRKSGEPNEENIRKLEGWILGQESGS